MSAPVCKHEAWEEIPLGGAARRCADCGIALPPIPRAPVSDAARLEALEKFAGKDGRATATCGCVYFFAGAGCIGAGYVQEKVCDLHQEIATLRGQRDHYKERTEKLEAALSAAEAKGREEMAREIAAMVNARARLIHAEAEGLGIKASRQPLSPMLVEAFALEELATRIEAKR